MTEETRTCPICGQQHRRGIGGSMMSQILGLSQWGNALDAYHALTRPDALYADEEIQSIDLFRGNALEPESGRWRGRRSDDYQHGATRGTNRDA